MSYPLSEVTLFHTLLVNDVPLLDVRSQGEFEHGAFPAAFNIPVLDNEQRARVGTCYKEEGSDKAIELGHHLISGKILNDRGTAWITYTRKHPNGYLYCARGGMRSHKVQIWLSQQGIDYPLIPGGYKSLRRYLLNVLDQAAEMFNFIVLGGPAGSGKTHFLHAVKEHCIDLEGLAHHRGSTFGRYLQTQPSQINFENQLAIALLKAQAKGIKTLILEDESKLIGQCCLPLNLQSIIKTSPVLLLEASISQRIDTIFHDYILDNLHDYQNHYGIQKGFSLFADSLLNNLKRISRRLGGKHYNAINIMMQHAIDDYQQHTCYKAFYPVIKSLLTEYYDPMYNYQLEHKPRHILARGDKKYLYQWLATYFSENNNCNKFISAV